MIPAHVSMQSTKSSREIALSVCLRHGKHTLIASTRIRLCICLDASSQQKFSGSCVDWLFRSLTRSAHPSLSLSRQLRTISTMLQPWQDHAEAAAFRFTQSQKLQGLPEDGRQADRSLREAGRARTQIVQKPTTLVRPSLRRAPRALALAGLHTLLDVLELISVAGSFVLLHWYIIAAAHCVTATQA